MVVVERDEINDKYIPNKCEQKTNMNPRKNGVGGIR